MPTKVYETRILCPVQKLWDFHSSANALRILTPPDVEIQVVSTNNDVREGALHVIKSKQFGLWLTWKARISKVNPPFGFTDTAEKSPFKSWIHHHDFIELDGECILRDTIHYQPPGGPIAKLINELMINDRLDSMFHHRHKVTKAMLESEKASVNTHLFDTNQEYVSDFELSEANKQEKTSAP
jgi:ligand-binding SRPBCC domain-containing protein